MLGELLPWLAERIRGLDDSTLRRPEKPGKWSVIEVIQHLADSDLVAGFRIRMMLSEDRPPLQGYDQDRWAGEFHYRDVALELALDQLRGLRAANLSSLEAPEPGSARAGGAAQRARAGERRVSPAAHGRP